MSTISFASSPGIPALAGESRLMRGLEMSRRSGKDDGTVSKDEGKKKGESLETNLQEGI